MLRFKLFSLFFFLASAVLAQSLDLPEAVVPPSMQFYSRDPLQESLRSDAAIDQFQSTMIEELFTKPMFQDQSTLFEFESDEEDEESVINSKAEKDMMNDLMSKEFAKVLAKKDMLKLKQKLKDQLHSQ